MGSLELDQSYITVGRNFSTSVMKENSPIIEITPHLNKAYFFVNFPNTTTSLNHIYRMQAYIIEYGSTSNGDLDPENIISELRVEFDPGKSIYAENSYVLPPHHFMTDINNSWYRFKFTYMYNPSTDEEGGDIWYSAISNQDLDNTTPNIFSRYISGDIKGSVQATLERDKQLTLWYNTSAIDSPKKGQAVKFSKEPAINQIKDTNGDGTFVKEPLDADLRNVFTHIFSDLDFQSTVYTYFENWLPSSGTIEIKFRWNRDTYKIIISGDIQALATDYFKEVLDG